jgi:5-methylcytosine-specific restriction endonuclease McrA
MTVSEIAKTLALAKSTVAYHARRLGYAPDSRFARRYDWDAVRAFYEEGHSPAECRQRFGFAKDAWYQAIERGHLVPRTRASEVERYLRPGSTVTRGQVKRGLLSAGLKASRCERCGISRWRGRDLVITLHHVNGDGSDNRLENLRMLCPNCHSQTDTYGGRNRPATITMDAGMSPRA